MRRALTIQKELSQVGTVKTLTSVFEGIASLRLAKIKNQVVSSKLFFAQLWQIYSQLRADPEADIDTQAIAKRRVKEKNVYLVITSEGSLSGDIDQKIIDEMLKSYNMLTTDIMVIGGHGATQLAQRKLPIARYFKLPDVDQGIDVSPIITELAQYQSTTVFYQTYVSLRQQDIAKIDLISAVDSLSTEAGKAPSGSEPEYISSLDYLFEPGVQDVIDYMESVMMGVALSQVILESKLAQYASRFNAMSLAEDKAGELQDKMRLDFYRAKRAESDERLKEVIGWLGQE